MASPTSDQASELNRLIGLVSAENVIAITPANADLSTVVDGLLVLTDGNVNFTAKGGGVSGTFPAKAGMIIPVAIRRVSTATTATVLGFI